MISEQQQQVINRVIEELDVLPKEHEFINRLELNIKMHKDSLHTIEEVQAKDEESAYEHIQDIDVFNLILSNKQLQQLKRILNGDE